MKNNRSFAVAAVIFMVIVAIMASACASQAPATSPAPASKPATSQAPASPTAKPTTPSTPVSGDKIKVGFATVAPGMETYPVAVNINDMVNRNSNLALSTMAGSGPQSPILSVNKGEAHLGGILTLSTTSLAFLGLQEFKDKSTRDIRLVMRLGTHNQSFVTTPATKITSIADLKGKKLTRFTAMTNTLMDAVLEAYGLDPQKDFNSVPIANYGLAFPELQAGRIDAVWAAFSGAQMLQLKDATGKAIVLGVDADKLEKARSLHPDWMLGIESVKVNPGDLTGLELTAPLPVTGTPLIIIAGKDTPDEMVTTYVKTVLAHASEVKGLIWTMKYFGNDTVTVKPVYPYHPGAIKAFKDLGIWTNDLEQAQQEALKK